MASLEPRIYFVHNGRPRSCGICGTSIHNVEPRIVLSDKTQSLHFHVHCSTWFARFVQSQIQVIAGLETDTIEQNEEVSQ